jgi:hypothetical protein
MLFIARSVPGIRAFSIAFVAVLDAPQISGTFGILQKRHQVRWADDVHRTLDPVAQNVEIASVMCPP